jgi:formylglycine-generating enzyme required for sulfatase activity
MRCTSVYSLVCVLLCSVSTAFAAPDWQALLAAVVKIEAGQTSIPGAGCLIKIDGNRGYILTAYHVIKEAEQADRQQVMVRFYQGFKTFPGIINREWIDTRNDLAVLVVENVPVQQILPLGSTQKLERLDDVIAIGHPSGSSWALARGQVSNFTGRDIHFAAAVDQGNSGGPLLDEQGQMIGLNVEMAGQFGVAIQADVITPILWRWIGPLSAPAAPTRPPTPPQQEPPASPPAQRPAPLSSTMQGKDGKEMRLVSEGWFEMGNMEGNEDEKPVHRVWVDAFYMDTYEVTLKEYQAFQQATKHRELPAWVSQYAPGDQYPVVGVSWDDAEAYCRWADKALPTEAQWEKAARGTDSRIYPWGNEPVNGRRANYCDAQCENDWKDQTQDDGYRYTAPVGSFAEGQSPYGIHDLAGNVWEWVRDWYHGHYYKQSPERNPENTTAAKYRVLRGGGWYFRTASLHAANRRRHTPSDLYSYLGFRCVVEVSAPRK